jgi:uncharacterized protein YqgQ
MSTPNFKTQSLFDLYVTDNFLIYPYPLDPNTDDYLLDENGNYIINYDIEPFFDHSYFDECKNYTDNKLNSKLRFFTISFEDGYYSGIQTFIKPKHPNDFDALDWLKYPQYYDNSQLFKDFGYNTYILKRKILAEINLINNKLLPQLKEHYLFDKICCVGIFSNGEAIYEKC